MANGDIKGLKVLANQIVDAADSGAPDFTNGLEINGQPLTTFEQGTWTGGTFVNVTSINVGSAATVNGTYQRVNNEVRARIEITGLSSSTGTDGGFTFQPTGLPGLVNSTKIYGEGMAGQSNGTIQVPCSVRAADNGGADTLISVSVFNKQGSGINYTSFFLTIYYEV